MEGYIRINCDNWDDAGKLWFVVEYKTRENSTAIDLTLKDSFGIIENRTVALNQIEWINKE